MYCSLIWYTGIFVIFTIAEMVAQLREIGTKIPSRHVLRATKVGLVLNHLRKTHPDPDVARIAEEIRAEWKRFYARKLRLPKVEKRSDKFTQMVRSKTHKLLADALMLPLNHHIPIDLEREFFRHKNSLLNQCYHKALNKLSSVLRTQKGVRSKVASGAIALSEIVAKYDIS